MELDDSLPTCLCFTIFIYGADMCNPPRFGLISRKKDLKIILCGDSAVGKSKMVERFLLETLVAAMGEKKGMHTDADMLICTWNHMHT